MVCEEDWEGEEFDDDEGYEEEDEDWEDEW